MPSVRDGRMRWLTAFTNFGKLPSSRASTVYSPVTGWGMSDPDQRLWGGSQWSHTPKMSWKMSPSQKIGITQTIVP